ncbi:GAF domain-containing protein [Cesiribacter sp. SM1]|uniref:GAF domain-containing protein n=1 Tax=Cesiribacter sp. SM1 TaxID=2861196 RepID=UPI001CD7D72F|nr:GAF domain-containing protein [Cesiribacter sp. SM1]
MNRKSTSFIFWKFYLPLAGLFFAVLLSFFMLHKTREKQQSILVLVQDIEEVQQHLNTVTVLLQKNGQAAIPAVAGQIGSGIAQVESSLANNIVADNYRTDWQVIRVGWQNISAVDWEAVPATGQQSAGVAAAPLKELQLQCLRLANQLETALESNSKLGLMALCAGIFLCICLVAHTCYFITHYLLQPLKKLEQQVGGLLTETAPAAAGSNVIYDPLFSRLQQYSERNAYLAQAAAQIGEGNFQQSEEQLYNSGVFGHAVLGLRDKMKDYFQAEHRRNWSSQGIEQFTKLLRERGQNLDGLCKGLVSELVPFVNASQGALFITAEEHEEEVLELKASYAWNRHKFLTKTIRYGEGLIGQVAQELDPLIITDVPEGYITIGSGLGRAKPRCILILPLLANDVFQGVLELASFHEFEAHELEFLKKLSESIASTLANLKSTDNTKELLAKANAANAHLQAQEEELRQNTEELMATQEAMRKKEVEFTGLFSSIDYSLFTAEFDLKGNVLRANEKLQAVVGIIEQDYGNLRCFQLLQIPDWTESDKKKLLDVLMQGNPQNLECKLNTQADTWISASFTPVLNDRGNVYKVMMLASDITEKKNAELAYVAQAEEIMVQEEKLRVYTAELETLQTSLSERLAEARQEMQRQIEEIAAEKAKNEAILEGCVDGVVSFNEKGTVEFFNHAAEEIWSASRLDVVGRKINRLISIEIQHQDGEPQVFFVKNGSRKALDIRTEVPLISASGEEIEALLTLTRVKVENTYLFTAFVQKVAVELF